MRCVMVLGVARSGTSCVAGILHHAGIHMTDVVEKGPANVQGLYEDPMLSNALLGLPMGSIPRERAFRIATRYFESRAAEGRRLWGVKVVRLLGIMDLLTPWLFENIGDVRLISLRRPVRAVHRSQRWARKFLGPIWSLEEQLCMLRRAIEDWPGPHIGVDYNHLVRQPKVIVPEILEFATEGMRVDVDTQAAVDFVDPKLRHF